MTTIAIAGTLTEAAHKTHVPLVFDVPEGVTRLTGRFVSTSQTGPAGRCLTI